MPTRSGNGYIVSFSVSPEMWRILNDKRKGDRSAFIRRCIYNADKYDEYVRKYEFVTRAASETVDGMMEVVRYLVSEKEHIVRGENFPTSYLSWRGGAGKDPFYKPNMRRSWQGVFDVIEELIPHIDGLSSVQRAIVDLVGGKNELDEEN